MTNLLRHSVGAHSSNSESATGTIAPTPSPVSTRAAAKVYRVGAKAEHRPKKQKRVPDRISPESALSTIHIVKIRRLTFENFHQP